METANERRLNASASAPQRPQELRLSAEEKAVQGLDGLIEMLMAWTQRLVGTVEIVNASERFYLDHGKVFHDDTVYAMRTAYFFDHFLFERKLSHHVAPATGAASVTPYALFRTWAETQVPPLPESLLTQVSELEACRHSLFQIIKLSDTTMVIRDLLVPAKIQVSAKAGETFRGLARKTILQGFVFSLNAQHYLSSGLILHPLKANRQLKRHLKQATKAETFSRKNLMAQLATWQIRHLRHRHVHPKLLYQRAARQEDDG